MNIKRLQRLNDQLVVAYDEVKETKGEITKTDDLFMIREMAKRLVKATGRIEKLTEQIRDLVTPE